MNPRDPASHDRRVVPANESDSGQATAAGLPLLRVLLPLLLVVLSTTIGARVVVLNERGMVAARRERVVSLLNQKLMELHGWIHTGNDPAALRTQLQVMSMDSAIEELALVGSGHRVLLSDRLGTLEVPGRELHGYDPAKADEARRLRRPLVVRDPGGAVVAEYMPVSSRVFGGGERGEAGLLFGCVDLTEEFRKLRVVSWNNSARLIAVLAAFVILLYALLDEAVIRRLRAVIGAMDRMSRGQLAVRSQVTGRDEIGGVGRAFNAMAEQLQRQHDLMVRSQARYQQVVEGSDDLVLVTTLLGRVLFVNQAVLTMVGLMPEECFGRSVYDFVAPEDLPAASEWAASVIAQRLGRSSTELRVVHADGSRRYVLLSMRRVRDADSSNEHFELFVRDRTEVFNAESEKRASQERFEALFDGARDAALLADADLGRILAVNRSAAALLGRSREELEGTSMEAVLPGIGAAVAGTVSAGAAEGTVEAELVGADGQRIPVEVNANVVTLPDGQRVVQASCRDMRERRRLEEQIAHSERMSVIGQLAGGVAHDFNNQLAGILGYAELLAMRLPEGPLRSYAQRIESSAQHSAELTSKLLAFSRRGKYREQAIEMHAVLDDVVGILRHSIDPRITVVTELRAASSWVAGDMSQLQSAVLNLGVNARDAMPEGGQLTIRTRVTSNTAPAGPPDPPSPVYLEIEVLDTGVGMDAAVLAHAFEPFFTTKPVGAGTGLGLAAVYGTVVGHHGTIHLDSEPGRGTSCRLWLPMAEAPDLTEREDEKAASAWSGARILVVDDEKPVRELLAETLESSGFVVRSCAGGTEALEAWKEAGGAWDLVLLDLMMPGMSGTEFLAELRTLAPEARVLLLSGYADEEATQRMVAAGARGMLNKPCPRDVLVSTVQRVLADQD